MYLEKNSALSYENQYFQSMNPELSFAILQCVMNGQDMQEIARIFNVPVQMVYFWCQTMKKNMPALQREKVHAH